eukprot:11830053-Ditylum_brightwellii.AAC.1
MFRQFIKQLPPKSQSQIEQTFESFRLENQSVVLIELDMILSMSCEPEHEYKAYVSNFKKRHGFSGDALYEPFVKLIVQVLFERLVIEMTRMNNDDDINSRIGADIIKKLSRLST